MLNLQNSTQNQEKAKQIIKEWILKDDSNIGLDLSNLNLYELPTIPNNCKRLFCCNNKLKSLPERHNIKDLFCSCNQLTSEMGSTAEEDSTLEVKRTRMAALVNK